MSCSELLLIGRLCNKPGEEGTVLDERLPSRGVPVHVFGGGHGGARLSAEEDHDGVGFGRDETEKEDVFGSAVVAFEYRVTERGARVELNLLVTCSNEMVDDMGGRGVASGAAEPFLTRQAFDHAARVVDAAVADAVSR